MPIQVLLSDDHQIVRQGLRALLEREGFKVVGEASNGQEAVRLTQQLNPDVAVLDLAMPILNGLEAAREIKRLSPRTKSVLLTMYTETHYVLEGLQAGASGFVLKAHAAEDLIQAIRMASKGRTYLSPEVSETLVQAYRGETGISPDPLSPRERQALQLIAEGKTTKEIATDLGISVKTAETHRRRLMEKLEIHQVAGLVRYAVRRGIIQP